MEPDHLLDKRVRRHQTRRQILLWFISVAVHVAIILLAARVLVGFFRMREAAGPIHVSFRVPLDIPGRPSEEPGRGPDEEPGIEATRDDETIEVRKPEREEIAMAGLQDLPFVPVFAPAAESDKGTSIFDNRTEAGRRDALLRGGGTGGTQRAVGLALEWLAKHQDEDGKWSPDEFNRHDPPRDRCTGPGQPQNVIGISSLSMLCFLAAGYTHTQGRYADVVGRGLDYLASVQRDTGEFSRPNRTNMYDQALATLVMVETAALAGDREVYERARRGVRVIIAAQQLEGGWDYAPVLTHRNDMSITGWQIITLRGAQEIGMNVPWELKYDLARFLDRVSQSSSLVHYIYGEGGTEEHRGFSSQAVTASALLARLHLGQTRQGEIERLARLVVEQPPSWQGMTAQADSLRASQNFYAWYYGTMALFQLGGETWDAWNRSMREQLVEHQRTDGSARGSWDPASHIATHFGGRVYSTALACLCLEVYYRYLRIYDLEGYETFGDVLLAALGGADDPQRKLDIISSLADYPSPAVVQALRETLRSDDTDLRLRAAKTLAELDQEFDMDRISELLSNRNLRVRDRTLALLEEIADSTFEPGPIAQLLSQETSPRIRSHAIRVLQRIATRDVVEPLIDALGDSDRFVAEEAAAALRGVTGTAMSFSADSDPAARAQAIEEWRRFWAQEKDSPDFGELRRIKAYIIDVLPNTGRVTISAGRRHRVAEEQAWTVLKEVSGATVAIPLRIVATTGNQSVAEVLKRSDIYRLSKNDTILYERKGEE